MKIQLKTNFWNRFRVVRCLSVIPQVYKGEFVDIDREIQLAYERYPFPWPSEKQYSDYALDDVLAKKDEIAIQFREFLRDIDFDEDCIRGKVVLELGAGVGWDSMALMSCGAKEVFAVDNSISSIEYGRHFAGLLGLKDIHFIQSSLYEIDQLEVVPDVIIAKGVLHHVFDLPRLVGSIHHKAGPNTQLLMTHSRYSTRMGLYKYINNHLAWMLGGADIEKRIDAGIWLFRKWTRTYVPEVVRDGTNDLAGVFYMARSARNIRRMFTDRGFKVEVIPNKTFVRHYATLQAKLEKRVQQAGNHTIMKASYRALRSQARVCNYLCSRLNVLNLILGHVFTILFTMPPHMLRIVSTEERLECSEGG
jgi:2-polyprenyl-3-methyl-5-hydroxy-6-metoxy-1,4-benzoquinol methylase